MEEMFTAIEFIKRKRNSELSIAHFFEDKHGFGAAIKEDVSVMMYSYVCRALWNSSPMTSIPISVHISNLAQ